MTKWCFAAVAFRCKTVSKTTKWDEKGARCCDQISMQNLYLEDEMTESWGWTTRPNLSITAIGICRQSGGKPLPIWRHALLADGKPLIVKRECDVERVGLEFPMMQWPDS